MKFMRELEENNMARAEGRKEGHEAGVADGILSSVRNLMELSLIHISEPTRRS